MKVHQKVMKRNMVLTFVGLLLLLFFLLITIKNTSRKILDRSFEKKSLSKLDLYQEGIARLTTEKITNKIKHIERLAKDRDLRYYVSSKDVSSIGSYLAENNQNEFDNLLVVDRYGKLIYIQKVKGGLKDSAYGFDYSQRDYFIKARTMKKPYVSDVLHSVTNYYSVVFVAPVTNVNDEMEYMLIGSKRLENMIIDFNFSTYFDSFYSVLLDSQGNLITNGRYNLSESRNFKKDYGYVTELMKPHTPLFIENTGLSGERAYIKSTNLKVGNNDFTLLSYFSLDEYRMEVDNINREIIHGVIKIATLSFMLFIFSWYLTYEFVKENIKSNG